MKQVVEQVGIDYLPEVASLIIKLAGNNNIWTFYGEMGAGKTTLVKQLCKQLGVTDEISSPTYSLVNEYKTITGKTIYHFDFYRINSIEEAYDIGYEDYFYRNNICLIEWPEKIAKLLKNEAVLAVKLEKETEATRRVIIDY